MCSKCYNNSSKHEHALTSIYPLKHDDKKFKQCL